MNAIIPQKLKQGDTVMVIAPSRTLSQVSLETRKIANERFSQMGINILFSEHAEESDVFSSSSIENRIRDIHNAFINREIKGIFTAIGGFNSNQLLKHIDWKIIKNNPKIFCGYSDITALAIAMLTKTGLATYSGPHYSSFGEKKNFEYSLHHFKKCFFSSEPIDITPSSEWTDDRWYHDQENRNPITNPGYLTIQDGEASGIILGGNLCTLNLLQGTEFFPNLADTILFLEDDSMSNGATFDRDLQSLIHQPGFENVRGLVLGRFQKDSRIDENQIRHIITTKKELSDIPVIAQADFGHTTPRFTFPIGGTVQLQATGLSQQIKIIRH